MVYKMADLEWKSSRMYRQEPTGDFTTNRNGRRVPVTYLFHWNDGRTTEDTMPMHLNTEPHGEFSMWKAEFNFEAFKKYFMGGQ